ncbi:hypothetical protein S83_027865 [Arachis hypogaea]
MVSNSGWKFYSLNCISQYNTTLKSLQAALLLSSLGSLLKRLKQEALSPIRMSSCSCVFHLPRPTSHKSTTTPKNWQHH